MTPDATSVVTAVRAVLTAQEVWQGTATELLHALAAADGTARIAGQRQGDGRPSARRGTLAAGDWYRDELRAAWACGHQDHSPRVGRSRARYPTLHSRRADASRRGQCSARPHLPSACRP